MSGSIDEPHRQHVRSRWFACLISPRTGAAGKLTGSTQRLGRTTSAGQRGDDRNGSVQIDTPARMHSQRPDTWLSTQPAADNHVVDSKRACRTSMITGPLAGGDQRSVRHSDRRQLQLRTEVQCQTRSSRMITGSRVQQQHIKITRQCPYGALHQSTNSQGHQPRHIRSVRGTADHLPLAHPTAKHDHCGRPCSVMISARTGERTRKAHPATADHGGSGIQAHRIRCGGGQLLLIVDQ
jgi:hypothetical protein